jgi:hypothetical protein
MKTQILMWSLSDTGLNISSDINEYLSVLTDIDSADAVDMHNDIAELMEKLTNTLDTQLNNITMKYFVD